MVIEHIENGQAPKTKNNWADIWTEKILRVVKEIIFTMPLDERLDERLTFYQTNIDNKTFDAVCDRIGTNTCQKINKFFTDMSATCAPCILSERNEVMDAYCKDRHSIQDRFRIRCDTGISMALTMTNMAAPEIDSTAHSLLSTNEQLENEVQMLKAFMTKNDYDFTELCNVFALDNLPDNEVQRCRSLSKLGTSIHLGSLKQCLVCLEPGIQSTDHCHKPRVPYGSAGFKSCNEHLGIVLDSQ